MPACRLSISSLSISAPPTLPNLHCLLAPSTSANCHSRTAAANPPARLSNCRFGHLFCAIIICLHSATADDNKSNNSRTNKADQQQRQQYYRKWLFISSTPFSCIFIFIFVLTC
ncbi:unnamed protein product [Protopolystoma xenopodis]|uniref:Uncharacterized protein n=1 Tax=Protopolystoma xenopodis TaxID=117903 RepID=A0A3S5AFN8_9PLAT|nr:unnamed protein product [Protopolystoma xenopodis]